MTKVGIIGGSFDPIHSGHLITANFVLEQRRLHKIIFIPCNISPHKTQVVAAENNHRLEMVKLAIDNNPRFECSDLEIQKGGISYTVETFKELKNKFDEIELIIGYDNLVTFDKWKDPDEIIKIAKLIVLRRSIGSRDIHTNKYYGEAIYVDTPIIEISSSEIRERVLKNLPIDYLVPEAVKKYIYKFNLYR